MLSALLPLCTTTAQLHILKITTTGFILTSFSMPPEPLVYPQTGSSDFFFPPANTGLGTESMTGHLTSRNRDHVQDVTTWLMRSTSPDGSLCPCPAPASLPSPAVQLHHHPKDTPSPCLAVRSLWDPSVALPEQLLLASNAMSKTLSGFGPGKVTPCSSCWPAKGCSMGMAARGQGAAAPRLGSAAGSRAGCVSKATGRLPAQGCTQKAGWGEHGGDTPELAIAASG